MSLRRAAADGAARRRCMLRLGCGVLALGAGHEAVAQPGAASPAGGVGEQLLAGEAPGVT